MNEFEKQLEQELLEQGISGEELWGLIEFKNKITKLSDTRRSDDFKRSFLQKLEKVGNHGQLYPQRRLFTSALIIAFLILILITGFVGAQKSLPGQPLYPVKILSENLIKTVNPSFKNEILKRRSEEIKSLTEEKKNSEQINNTINKYEKDLEENKKINPAKIEETRRNLEDARDNSEDEDRKEIEHVIIQTDKKINELNEDEDEKKNEDVKGVGTKKESDRNEDDEGDRDQNKRRENKGEDRED